MIDEPDYGIRIGDIGMTTIAGLRRVQVACSLVGRKVISKVNKTWWVGVGDVSRDNGSLAASNAVRYKVVGGFVLGLAWPG